MPSGCVIASGPLHKSNNVFATLPFTSVNARSLTLRLVRLRRIANCDAIKNKRSGKISFKFFNFS